MDMSGLPPFWLAYLSDPSDSGRIHSNIRQRWLSGASHVNHYIGVQVKFQCKIKQCIYCWGQGCQFWFILLLIT